MFHEEIADKLTTRNFLFFSFFFLPKEKVLKLLRTNYVLLKILNETEIIFFENGNLTF